jgi:hypothetical protein
MSSLRDLSLFRALVLELALITMGALREASGVSNVEQMYLCRNLGSLGNSMRQCSQMGVRMSTHRPALVLICELKDEGSKK